MRSIVLYELMSLDGIAEDPSKWFGDVDHRYKENLAEVISTQDTVLLGRRTFEEWAAFWPASQMQPFADFISNTPKYVFSSDPLRAAWSHTTHVSEDPCAFVDRLRSGEGGDIGIHGSLTLARSLLEKSLVDELRLVVTPTLAGEGARLFGTRSSLLKFELIESSRSGGSLLLHYRLRRR